MATRLRVGPGAAFANGIVSCSRAGPLQGRYRVLGAAPLRLPGAVRVWRSALRPARIELATFRVLAGVVATRLWVHLVLAARAGQMAVRAQGWCRAGIFVLCLAVVARPCGPRCQQRTVLSATPGQDRTGDLQRVRLTSWPLDHGCTLFAFCNLVHQL